MKLKSKRIKLLKCIFYFIDNKSRPYYVYYEEESKMTCGEVILTIRSEWCVINRITHILRIHEINFLLVHCQFDV